MNDKKELYQSLGSKKAKNFISLYENLKADERVSEYYKKEYMDGHTYLIAYSILVIAFAFNPDYLNGITNEQYHDLVDEINEYYAMQF